MKPWTLDELKNHLRQRKEIKGWILTEEHVSRCERYFMSENRQLIVDQDRSVNSKNIVLRLFVYSDKPSRQGEITKKLFQTLSIQEQLDLAIEAAEQTDHPAWDLPTSVPQEIASLATADPRIAEDIQEVMADLTRQIASAANSGQRKASFNSAELFLSIHHREIFCSNGLTHRSSQSRIYGETAFSFSRPDPRRSKEQQSDEFMTSAWAVHLDDFPVQKLFDDAATLAEQSLDVAKPQTGAYSVIIHADVLSELLNGSLSHLSAASSYHALPFLKPGAEFVPQCSGDQLTLTLDPTLDFGAYTTPISDQGILQKPLKLVDSNRVVATATDKQYADYLQLKPTTHQGNLVVAPGSLDFKEMTQAAPQVIEIIQFSGLFCDPISGTFSSEIRLARLYDNQKKIVSYIKGGSLSGSITENFRKARLSSSLTQSSYFNSESTFGRGYFGPQYALLNDVSIVG